MKNEIWKQVDDSRYLVSNMGRVIGPGGVISNGNLNSGGYYQLKVYNRNKLLKVASMHRMVMELFVGPDDRQVNHKNGIKTDNRLENLEYTTAKENMAHAIRNGLIGRYKLNAEEKKEILKLFKAGASKNSLGKKFHVSAGCIYHLCHKNGATRGD